ncbi:MAG: hypothetical protein IJ736_10445, partial [Firmicutes bacterium]|nr:hypothetical protein [Bacillota bacterium]
MMENQKAITKTVLQYSKELSPEIITELISIAVDYNKVKNYVYGRYSGINSLEKLTPGYTALNEMRYCGLRQQLNLPVVYFELAIFDALRDIKAMWGNLKNNIADLVRKNENLQQDDRVYMLTVLRYSSAFNAILAGNKYEMPKNADGLQINTKKLNNLLCRYVRRHKPILKSGNSNTFTVSPAGYKYYGNGVIGFSSRIPRKRIRIDLKDKDVHSRQLKVYVEENYVKIAVPIDVEVRNHDDYTNTIYLHIGFANMFTLSNGNVYGKDFNELVNTETRRLSAKNRERFKVYKIYSDNAEKGRKQKCRRIKCNNMGKKKYDLQKKIEHTKMTTFVNAEINRMFKQEKPGVIVSSNAISRKGSNNT